MEPKNLDECIVELRKNLQPEALEALKSGKITTTSIHHTLGRQLRNGWNLWSDSELKRWFESIGIHHPDDMSSIILDSFVKSIRQEPIDLDKQVKFYQAYWEAMKNKKQFTIVMENHEKRYKL